MTPETRARRWRPARPWLPLAAVLVVYGVVRWGFVHAAGSQGLVTPGRPPGRPPDRGLVVLALAALVLRVTVLVAVPAVIAYRIAAPVLRRLIARRRRRPAPSRDEIPRPAEPPR